MRNHFPYDAIMISTDVQHNISAVDRRIRAAEDAAGRPTGCVSLLAVSKTKPPDQVREAYKSGLTAFGENYAQEMAEKAAALADLPLSWHFIGPIQSNKTALIAEVSDWVHSIDRLKVARRLSEQRPEDKAPLNVLVQINTSNEDSKSGVGADAAPELMAAINELPGLRLRGLMTIPAATTDQMAQREPFRQLRELMTRLSDPLPQLDTLSMGMSGDLEAAVSEGANIVRVGTDIFGARYN